MTQQQSGCDIAVLGAGVIGICCALSLVERGFRVRLIDRDEPGQATSYGNAGIVSPWSIVPQSTPGLWKKIPSMLLDPHGPVSIRPGHFPKFVPWGLKFLKQGNAQRVAEVSRAMELLNRDNVTLYRHHLAGTGKEDLLKDAWYVHAFRNEADANPDGDGYRMRKAVGAEIERISAGELHELEPAISKGYRAAVLIKGQARAMSPALISKTLQNKFKRLGGEVVRTVVTAIKPDGESWIYTAEGQDHSVPRLVLAMGVWSAKLLEPLGIKIPLEAERGYHVEFPNPGLSLNHSVMDAEMHFVASSMLPGLRVAGTAEFAGLDQPINEKRLNGLAKLARDMLPDLDASGMRTWMGQRPSLPDSLPCIGEIDGYRGLIGAFGHAHYGLMMAPKTGHLVADIASHTKNNEDLSPFAVRRFEGAYR